MKINQRLIFALALLCLPLAINAQQWSGVIAPSRAANWTDPGVPGGIPSRTTVCTTLSPGATSAQINSAIAACPAGHVVYLNAGTYNLSGAINISRSDVTLRGAGPDKTKLVFASGSGCGNTTSDICVSGSSNWSGGPDNLTTWTAGYQQGSNVVTLGSVTNLSPGKVLILDQTDDSSDTGGVYVCGTTSCTSEGAGGGGGRGDNHAQMQFAEVTAVNTTTKQVTISPAIYMPNWRASQNPGAWWANKLAANVGIEGVLIDNRTAKAGSLTVFNNAYKSWMRNVASIGGGSRSHVDLQYSARITIRDSYFWGAAGQNLSYGVETWMSGNNLIENNIFQHVTSPMLIGATSGTVYGYNFVIDQYSTNAGWLYPSAMEHDPGSNMNLLEGNQMPNAMEDSIHGTHNFGTFFRNQLSGRDPGGSQTSQTVPLLFQAYSRYANIIGNVLGTSGYHTAYQTNYGSSGTSACNNSIYNMGWSSTVCSSGGTPNDTVTINTAMRWGNYDTVSAAARWQASEVPSGLSQYANPVPANNNLPASFYLTAKPSWWGSMPWPAAGPEVTGGTGPGGHAYDIPAKVCYGKTSKDSSGIAIFNADNCYAAATRQTKAVSTVKKASRTTSR